MAYLLNLLALCTVARRIFGKPHFHQVLPCSRTYSGSFLPLATKILLAPLSRGLDNLALPVFTILFPQSQVDIFTVFWVPEQGLWNVSDRTTVRNTYPSMCDKHWYFLFFSFPVFLILFKKVQIMTHEIDFMRDQWVVTQSLKGRADLTQY